MLFCCFTRSSRSAPEAGRQEASRSRTAGHILPGLATRRASPALLSLAVTFRPLVQGQPLPVELYFTKRGTVAKDPTLAGALVLMVLLDGPPDRLPAGANVLVPVAAWRVTVLTFQLLLG